MGVATHHGLCEPDFQQSYRISC